MPAPRLVAHNARRAGDDQSRATSECADRINEPRMPRLSLTFASCKYDRMEALRSGEVAVEGVDLNMIVLPSGRADFRPHGAAGRNSISPNSPAPNSSACMARGDCPFVALPVFPSRVFRHGYIFINTRAGIRTPKDLEGKRVGLPLYTQTAAIWVRGHLQHQFGVDLDDHPLGAGRGRNGRHARQAARAAAAAGRSRSSRTSAAFRSASFWRAARSTRYRLAQADELRHASRYRARCFPTTARSSASFTSRRKIFPIMHLVAMRRASTSAPLDREQPLRRLSSRPSARAARACATTARSRPCCRGCRTKSRRSTRCSAAILGPTASSPTGRRWRRWCSTWSSSISSRSAIPIEELFVPLPGASGT